MATIFENGYIDKFGNMLNKYNDTYHITFKIMAVDVIWSRYIDFDVENTDKNPNFKVHNYKQYQNFKIFRKWLQTKLVRQIFFY